MVAFARALLTLAACCLGESRREWALAMQREFHSAVEDGRPLGFAIGCLIAAWREMPSQAQGRFTLANHALALGLLLPMAVLQLKCVAGLPYLSLGEPGLYAMLAAGSPQEVVLGHAYHSAIPALLTLWLLLGAGHLRLAWLLLERDWAGAAKTAALTVAASATLRAADRVPELQAKFAPGYLRYEAALYLSIAEEHGAMLGTAKDAVDRDLGEAAASFSSSASAHERRGRSALLTGVTECLDDDWAAHGEIANP